MTNEGNDIKSPVEETVAISKEDLDFLREQKVEATEKKRKVEEQKALDTKRAEVWDSFQKQEGYETLKTSGFDDFIKGKPQYLDNPDLLADAVRMYTNEIKLKTLTPAGDTAGEAEDDSAGSQKAPNGKGGGGGGSGKVHDLNSSEFLEAFSSGGISIADIDKMPIDEKNKIFLKQNLPTHQEAGMNTFFNSGKS